MKRTLLSGLLVPSLMAVVPGGCGGNGDACEGVDLTSDPLNCGTCGNACEGDLVCSNSRCEAPLLCALPTTACGGACVDTQTSAEHCGGCDDACTGAGDTCVAGGCATPLVALATVKDDGPVARDLYVLRDRSFTTTRLNDGAFATDRVVDHAILPDGRVLLVAAQVEGVFELWLASPAGGPLTRVNAPLPAGRDVLPGIAVSADGTKVLYRADGDTDDVFELYVASLASPGSATKVNGALVAGGEVSRVFALSANGGRATYIADAETDDTNELYTVDLTAASPAPVKLPTLGEQAFDFVMTPDGARVVYRTRITSLGREFLAVTAVAAPTESVPVDYADGAEGHVTEYRLTPDGTGLAFVGGNSLWQESLWYLDLTAAPYTATRLVDGSDYAWVREKIAFTPNGAHIVLRKGDVDDFSFERLYRVAVGDPSSLTRLSPAGTDVANLVTDFALSPDGTRAVFRTGADGGEGYYTPPGTEPSGEWEVLAPQLHVVDLTGAAPAPVLVHTATVDHDGIGGGYVVTGDGVRVVFRADDAVVGKMDAYLASLVTTADALLVTPPLLGSSDATDVSKLSRF